jgi:FMN phosphatase YigB (HAD superfamily)
VETLEELDGDGFVPRTAFFAAVCERYGLDDDVGALVAGYRASYPENVRPVDAETGAALAELRAGGWRIGIATNGEPSQRRKIELAGLDGLVDGWAISSLVGARKPEPAHFLAAADACACALDGGWMVGDNPEADVGGAVACGLRSAWIARGRDWQLDAFRPDVAVATVAEAVELILRLT